MSFIRRIALLPLLFAATFTIPNARGQVVINEIVEDEQDYESTVDPADTREFVELYNSGNSSVDISGWTLTVSQFAPDTGTPVVDTFPNGSIIAPGGYFLIAGPGIPDAPNVYKPFAGELWLNTKTIFELRNPNLPGTNKLVDAVALETFRGNELDMATQDQLDQIGAGQTAGVGARGGWWGQIESNNAHPSDTGPNSHYPNLPMSLGRYRDGYDHNVNGRDFGMLPATPNATNNLPFAQAATIANVDSLANGAVLRDDFYASFKLPTVISPGTADTYNPNAITINPTSPQGGKAIIAWDETGGGNVVYSKKYANEYKLYAYIDPRPFNNATVDSTQSEATTYGLVGSSDMFFSTPNSGDLLTGQPGAGGNITSAANGNTGLGWMIQRRTSNAAGTQSSKAILQLIDFNDGGDGVLADNDWQIKHEVDMTGMQPGWHVLGIKYDPATGAVIGTYDSQTINFTTTTDLVGNFYVGYREQLPGVGLTGRPPTFDLFVPVGVAGDYNNNGVVDAADYVLWKNGGPLQNEVASIGTNDAADYDAWRARFGNTTGSGSAAGVPEPGALGLLIVAGVVAGWVRRTR
jgi:hypothetical protein